MKKIFLLTMVVVLLIGSNLLLPTAKASAGSTPDNLVATSKATTVTDIHKLLSGWTVASVSSKQYNNSTYIKFEKVEPIGKKWAANQLMVKSWSEKGSFNNDVNAFIKQLKQSGVEYNIKKNTSSVFEATNFNGAEYVYHYIVKTNEGYKVYELMLDKVNEGWRYGVADNETLTNATVNKIAKIAPTIIQKFKNFKFVDTLKKEPVFKSFSLKNDWKLTSTEITGNSKTEYVPNGWTRDYEKVTNSQNYSVQINKTVISKQKYSNLLNKHKNIAKLTNSSKKVKAYRMAQSISVIDDEVSARSGDNRIVFVVKPGSTTVEYYKIYFDVPKPFLDEWNKTEKDEANKTFDFIINSLIKANP